MGQSPFVTESRHSEIARSQYALDPPFRVTGDSIRIRLAQSDSSSTIMRALSAQAKGQPPVRVTRSMIFRAHIDLAGELAVHVDRVDSR